MRYFLSVAVIACVVLQVVLSGRIPKKGTEKLQQTMTKSHNTHQARQSCPAAYTALHAHHSFCQPRNSIVTSFGITAAQKAEIVTAHNEYRGNVNPKSSAMAKMVWDEEIAIIAEKFAETCPDGHEDSGSMRKVPGYGVSIGQNLAWGYSDWAAAIKGWHDEVNFFTLGHGSNTGEAVGHYTQIVYDSASRIGCGYAKCSGTKYVRYYVCNYGSGQQSFKTPYEASTSSCSKCSASCSYNLCDCNGLLCKNGGTLDMNACTYSCESPYVPGTNGYCAESDCPDLDGPGCWFWKGQDKCTVYSNWPTGCPNMCGTCPVKCANKNTDVCSKYGGVNMATCKCNNCPAKDPYYCGNWPSSYCTRYTNVPGDCPYMCGVCQ